MYDKKKNTSDRERGGRVADKRSFSTTCDSALEAAVAARVKAELKREALWWRPSLRAVQAIPDAAERGRARGLLEAERLERRRRGQHLASRDALFHHYLPLELAGRGWDRDYDPVPEDQASVPGRRVGVARDSGRTGDRAGRLACNLPEWLWEKVRRAAYWNSEPFVIQLRELAAVSHRRNVDASARDELRAKIVTTGDLLRAAAKRAIGGQLPPPPNASSKAE